MRTQSIKPRRPIHALCVNSNTMHHRNKIIGCERYEQPNNVEDYEETSSETDESPSKKNSYILECASRPIAKKYVKANSQSCRKVNNYLVNIGKFSFVFCFIMLVFLLFSIVNHKEDNAISENIDQSRTAKLLNDIKELASKFPMQNNFMWIDFYSGIKEIATSNPTVPSVFLLLHTNDASTSECLVQKLAHQAAKFLNESSPGPIVIRGKKIKMDSSLKNDYGLFISTYKPDVEKRHVMVVHELEDIPPEVAQAFHSLCDGDNPTVKKAAYLFTLKVAEQLMNHPPRSIAEHALDMLWNKTLPTNIREPLITRVANIVLLVQPEKYLPC